MVDYSCSLIFFSMQLFPFAKLLSGCHVEIGLLHRGTKKLIEYHGFRCSLNCCDMPFLERDYVFCSCFDNVCGFIRTAIGCGLWFSRRPHLLSFIYTNNLSTKLYNHS